MSTLPHLDELTVLPEDPKAREMRGSEKRTRRLPAWLKRPIPISAGNYFTKSLVSELGLETICEQLRYARIARNAGRGGRPRS